MIFWQTFLDSLRLPSKKAVFKLNRSGMDITVIYMFMLIFLVQLPVMINQIAHPTGVAASLNILFMLIYVFMFSYLPLTIMVFIALSIIAYIGTFITRIMQRKLRFSILWKMSAYATTIPLLLYALISFMYPLGDHCMLLIIIYVFLFLIKIISIYPKRRKRN
ncbi:DUF1189 domain-containing protein [Ornithinibacillus gellani]|uniref:DUF1189 family protein n=1 Tax=Ornithinibacillus gellani TaxID=2293253 RepID=UPI000F4A189D|nr:DUF1189 family protein [Ornithinibacillus gellani]TQS76324.1 DUF1189 domain-containing protein [Ornithinibacillus gellani]